MVRVSDDGFEPDDAPELSSGPDLDAGKAPEADPRLERIVLVVALTTVAGVACLIGGAFKEAPQVTRFSEGTPLNRSVVAGIYLLAVAYALALLIPRPRRAVEAEPEQPICYHCFVPFREGVHFCPDCSAPLTTFATTGGIESVYAQAWCLGRAVHGPSNSLHVLGTGMNAAPALLMPLALLTTIVADAPVSSALFGLGAWVGIALIDVVIFWRAWMALGVTPDEPYGDPPYWTYDRWWRLPRDPSSPPPLPPVPG